MARPRQEPKAHNPGNPDAAKSPRRPRSTRAPGAIESTQRTASAAVMDAQGRVVIVGTDQALPAAVRVLPDGRPDYSFGGTGKVVIDFQVSGIDSQSDGFGVALDRLGRILVIGQGGPPEGQQMLLARLWP